jgi:hypothetical protein
MRPSSSGACSLLPNAVVRSGLKAFLALATDLIPGGRPIADNPLGISHFVANPLFDSQLYGRKTPTCCFRNDLGAMYLKSTEEIIRFHHGSGRKPPKNGEILASSA